MSKGNLFIIIGCIILLYVTANFFIHSYQSQQLLKQVKASVLETEPSQKSSETENSVNDALLFAKEAPVRTIKEKQNATEKTEENQLIAKEQTTEATQQPAEAMETKVDISAIGIMKISKIDLELPIVEGMSQEALKVALGHDEKSGYPGEVGNFVVSGHRAYVYDQLFNRLNEVEINDTIEVTTKEGNYKYQVNDISVVNPDELSVTEPTKTSTITLITCTPISTGTHRLIVRGELVQPKE